MYMTTVLCTEFYFTAAYLSVRTEPLSDIGQTGRKKKLRHRKNRNFTSVFADRASFRAKGLLRGK